MDFDALTIVWILALLIFLILMSVLCDVMERGYQKALNLVESERCFNHCGSTLWIQRRVFDFLFRGRIRTRWCPVCGEVMLSTSHPTIAISSAEIVIRPKPLQFEQDETADEDWSEEELLSDGPYEYDGDEENWEDDARSWSKDNDDGSGGAGVFRY